ncbi:MULTISPECIES: CPBP family intramembrane glutamic endopeptidase [unclassified Enterococcus]|uniref:CPBP family intramembrane glutamic endopeptidase n=1 Tax=unclassified Enterococcus TaxID=2608891 RepID=UPI003D2AF5DC
MKNKLFMFQKEQKRATSPIIAILVMVGLFAIGAATQIAGAFTSALLIGFKNIEYGSIKHAGASLIASVIGFGTVALLVMLWVQKYEKRSWRSLGLYSDNIFFKLIRGYLIGAIIIGISIFMSLAFGWTERIAAAPKFPIATIIIVLLISFFTYLIQGGAEEIQCRGFLMQTFGARFGILAGVFAQALIFVAIHGLSGLNWRYAIFVFTAAIFFALYALWEESLWGVIGLHGAYNLGFFVVGVTYMGIRNPGTSLAERNAENLDLASIPIMLAAIIVLAVFLKNKHKLKEN